MGYLLVRWRLHGEMAGYVAGEMAGYVAGEMAGYVAGEMAGYVAGEMAGYVAGEFARCDGGLLCDVFLSIFFLKKIKKCKSVKARILFF